MIISRDLKSQTQVVIEQLKKDNNMTTEQAIQCWYTSKTKAIIEEKQLFYVSGMRCYWELTLEMNNNIEKWMKEPFDM